jgi:hypothetical protein
MNRLTLSLLVAWLVIARESTEGSAIDIRHIHGKRHPTKRINGQSDVRSTHCPLSMAAPALAY